MTCSLNEEQIQNLLDGAPEHISHAVECTECQDRLAALQKLRNRLAPPPSPLGKDFARATAARVLEKAGPQRPRSQRESNPLQVIVRRERNRRFFRLPSLAAVLLLFSVPGYLFSFGEVERQMAYFGTVQFGLTVILPLALLALEWSTLSSLVRGRCLEEILSTGLAPRTVTDTLASNGMRSLAPLLLLTSLALLPFAGRSALLWLPIAAITFVGCNYAMQAQMLIANRSPLMGLTALGACLAALLAHAPWNFLALGLLVAISIAGRSQVVAALTDMQQGKTPARNKRPGRRLEMWLSRRLPDLALLQRELRRGGLFSPGWMVATLGGWAVCWYFSIDLSRDLIAPLIFGAALAISASLLQRERASGTHEVLLHSGLTREDWSRSCAWISGLKLAPFILLVAFGAGSLTAGDEIWPGPLRALGLVCLMLVCNWSGAMVGIVSVWEGSLREASGRAISHCFMAASYYLAALLLFSATLGDQRTLANLLGDRELLGIVFNDLSIGVLSLLMMLALWLRARQVSSTTWNEQPVMPALALVPAIPVVVSVQLLMSVKPQAAVWWGSLSLCLSILWSWWAIPLLRHPWTHRSRWALLTLSYLATVVAGSYIVAWLLVFSWNDQLLRVIDSRVHLNLTSLSLAVCLWSLTIAMLGQKMHWKPARPSRSKAWAWLPLSLTFLTACLGLSWTSYLNRSIPNRARVEGFIQRVPSSVPEDGAYSRLPRIVVGEVPNAKFRQELHQLLQQKAPADKAVPHLCATLIKSADRFWETGQWDEAITSVELLVALEPLLQQFPYIRADDSRRLATRLLQTGRLDGQQVGRLEQAMLGPDGVGLRRLQNRFAYGSYLEIRQAEGDRTAEGQLYLNQQSLLYLSGYLAGTPAYGSELHQLYLRRSSPAGSTLWAASVEPSLALEKIRLTQGAYPETFDCKGLIRYQKGPGQSYGLTLIHQRQRLELRGGHGGQ